MTLLRAAAATHTGYVRATNQDLALVSGDLVAVADGMGGHLGGEVAARMAIEELLDAFQRDRTGTGLVKAVRRANRTIWKRSRVERKLHGMGTTLTAAALIGDGSSGHLHLALVNIGDSRAYAIDHATHELRQLTEDHSVVEEMVRQGELTPEQAAVHPHRHVLTRALGIDAEVELDTWDLEPTVGSRFLLCSDGLTNELDEDEIGEILETSEEPEEAARELVGRALGHGGTDNVTVVVIDVLDGAGDSDDMRVALVPARAPQPERPPGHAPDITEAIPITAPPISGAPDEPAETIPVVAPPVAVPPVAMPPVVAPQAAGPPDDVPAPRPDEDQVAPQAADLAAGPAAGATAEAAAVVAAAASGVGSEPGPDDPPPTELVHRVGDGERLTGRSMTVRSRGTPLPRDGLGGPMTNGQAAAAAVPTGLLSAGVGAPGRPVVLVRRAKERGKDRIVTFRVALFMILVAAVAAGTAAVVIWFEQSSYYVGLDGNSVAIYQGRPSGVLWFKPRLISESQLTTQQVLPSAIAALKAGILTSTEQDAEKVVSNLTNERARLTTGINLVPPATGPPPTYPSSTTSPVTSTTGPGRARTTSPGPTTTAPGQTLSTTPLTQPPPAPTTTTSPPTTTSTTTTSSPTTTTTTTIFGNH